MAAPGDKRHSGSSSRKPTAAGDDGGAGSPMRFVFPSDFARGREVQGRILDEVVRQQYPSDTLFGIKLALEEGLVNAIKHGNKLDPRKQVKVEASVTPAKVEISIEDEGPGFSRSSVPDPTEPENIEKSSGRGILLIEAYMSDVSWSHGGRRLHMVKLND